MNNTLSPIDIAAKKETIEPFPGHFDADSIAHLGRDTLLDMLAYKDQVIEKKAGVIEQLKQRIERLEGFLRLEAV